MRSKFLTCFLCLFLMYTVTVNAKELLIEIQRIVAKMKIDFNLTDEQAEVIKPILQKYISKRQDFFASLEGDPMINKKSVRLTLRKIRQEENGELAKVLSQEQMQKLVAKQNLRDSLNKDQIDFGDGFGGDFMLNPEGGSLRF